MMESSPRWLVNVWQVLGAQQTCVQEPVPFGLMHRWQAEVVLPQMAQALPQERPALLALQSLHQRAALGVNGRLGEWRATLKPVLLALYRRAYPYESAYATAHESALAYGHAPANAAMIAEHFGHAEAFAEYYAQLNTDASASSFAQAHAAANAELAARAFATNDAEAYAAVCAASLRVFVWACATTDDQRRSLFNTLASGLNHCLATLQSPLTGERHE